MILLLIKKELLKKSFFRVSGLPEKDFHSAEEYEFLSQEKQEFSLFYPELVSSSDDPL